MKLSIPTSINTFQYFVTSIYNVNALDKDEADSLFWEAHEENNFEDRVNIGRESITRVSSYRDGAEVQQFDPAEGKWVEVNDD